MQVDAIILAGGRSSRLGGEPKGGLLLDGESLLQRTLAAAVSAASCRTVVVVGDEPPAAQAQRVRDVIYARESPNFGGPASAIGAGMAAARSTARAGMVADSDFTLVLACDMPDIAAAVETLIGAGAAADDVLDGFIGVDVAGHDQYLAALYRTASLSRAVNRCESAADPTASGLMGLSVRALVADLALVRVSVPAGSTADIDTWDDVDRRGIRRP
ncbi:molybdenum cofactor guanylyltransferase [Glaciihabitans tibetensis]|nr:NTP transferase domain-containing protein [Glaciihabitans tibetensis]